jgi:general stress protein 26
MKVTDSEESRRLLVKAVERIRVAMLVTTGGEEMHSRPMWCAGVDADTLWFLSQDSTPKTTEASGSSPVNVSFSDAEHGIFVSVAGTSELLHDPKLVEKFWKSEFRKWFPQGVGDPNLGILRIDVTKVEAWQETKGN